MKKLTLFAAAALCAAGAAQAQSSVTLYGLVDMGIEVADPGNGTIVRVQSGQWFGSRFGLRVVEDLGSGFKANAVLESGTTADVGGFTNFGTNVNQTNPVLFDRQVFVGIDGPIGTVRLGRQFSLTDNVKGEVEPFVNGTAGDTSPLRTLNPSRTANAIIYYTPSFGGFKAGLLYSTGNELTRSAATSKKSGQEASVNGQFSSGPIYVGAAYDETYTGAGLTPNRAEEQKVRSWIVGSSYDLKFLKLHGWVNGQKADAVGTGADVLARRDFLNWAFGVTAPVGDATKLYAAYALRNDKTSVDRDANKWGVGVSHNLSKRTVLYAAYGQTTNENRFTAAGAPNGAGITQGSGAAAGVALPDSNADPKSFTMGIRHSF